MLALLAHPPHDTAELFVALDRAIDNAKVDSRRTRALAIRALRHNNVSWPAMAKRTGRAQSTLRSWEKFAGEGQ